MAWLEEHPTSGHFKICFRLGKRKFKKTFKTTSKKDAAAALAQLEENIRLVERGRLELPPDADIGTFLLSDGKISSNPLSDGCATSPDPGRNLRRVYRGSVQWVPGGEFSRYLANAPAAYPKN